MKKVLVLIFVVVMVFSIVACGAKTESTSNDSTEQYTLKLAHVNNAAYPYTDGSELFKKLVEEGTDGNVIIEIYPDGQLGSERELIEQTQLGTLDFCVTATAPVSNFIDSFKVFDLPYIFKDQTQEFEVLDGEVGQAMLKEVSDIGLTGLGFWDNGVRSPSNSKRAINSMADLKGLKIRVMENDIMIASYKAMGAIPTSMAWGEVFTAVQQGVVDGLESSPVTYSTNALYDIQPYYAVIEPLFSPALFMGCTANLEKLPEEYMKVITEAAKEATLFERETFKTLANKSVKDLVANGMTVTEPDKAEFINACEVVYDEFGDSIGWDLINSIRDTN